MLPIRTLILSLSLLTAAASSAQAQQPFVTDDANVTPKGHFHFELSNEFDLLQRSSYPSLRQNTADFELDYGIGGGVEIRNFRLAKGQLQCLIGGSYAVKKKPDLRFWGDCRKICSESTSRCAAWSLSGLVGRAKWSESYGQRGEKRCR